MEVRVMDHPNEQKKPGAAPDRSAATGAGPAQPWDKQGRKPDRPEDDEPHTATGMQSTADRRADQDEDDDLEDALEQTYPASDPVSATQIVTPGKPPKRDR
jgi:hypothetical protein